MSCFGASSTGRPPAHAVSGRRVPIPALPPWTPFTPLRQSYALDRPHQVGTEVHAPAPVLDMKRNLARAAREGRPWPSPSDDFRPPQRRSPPGGCRFGARRGAPTRLVPERFAAELAEHPNRSFVEFVVDGVTLGFSLDSDTPTTGRGPPPPNHRSCDQSPGDLDRRVEEELADAVLIEVPDELIEFVAFSPFGLATKAGGKWRVITDLSWPRRPDDDADSDGESAGFSSVNAGIDAADSSLRYATVAKIAELIRLWGPGSRLACVDLKSGYRQVAIHPSSYAQVGGRWGGRCFVDTRLCFGARSACRTFSAVTEAVRWIAQRRIDARLQGTGTRAVIVAYIDDFCVVGQAAAATQVAFDILLETLADLGLVVNDDKTTEPTAEAIFLGTGLCTTTMSIFLPDKKVADLEAKLGYLASRAPGDKVTRAVLQSIVGKLTWCSVVLVQLRSLCSEFIRLSSGLLCPHSRVRVSGRLIEDAKLWLEFIKSRNYTMMIPEVAEEDASTLPVYGDAAGSEGAGAFAAGTINEFYTFQWPPEWVNDTRPQSSVLTGTVNGVEMFETLSSALQEAACIAVSVLLYGLRQPGGRIRVQTDSMSAFLAFAKGRSSVPAIDRIIREVQIDCARADVSVAVEWAPRTALEQRVADDLSRQSSSLLQQAFPNTSWTRSALPHGLVSRVTDCLRGR